jgi:hypothetical protein
MELNYNYVMLFKIKKLHTWQLKLKRNKNSLDMWLMRLIMTTCPSQRANSMTCWPSSLWVEFRCLFLETRLTNLEPCLRRSSQIICKLFLFNLSVNSLNLFPYGGLIEKMLLESYCLVYWALPRCIETETKHWVWATLM